MRTLYITLERVFTVLFQHAFVVLFVISWLNRSNVFQVIQKYLFIKSIDQLVRQQVVSDRNLLTDHRLEILNAKLTVDSV